MTSQLGETREMFSEYSSSNYWCQSSVFSRYQTVIARQQNSPNKQSRKESYRMMKVQKIFFLHNNLAVVAHLPTIPRKSLAGT